MRLAQSLSLKAEVLSKIHFRNKPFNNSASPSKEHARITTKPKLGTRTHSNLTTKLNLTTLRQAKSAKQS